MASKEEELREVFVNWMQELKENQESDADQRDNARECDSFLLDKDGQWEDDIARVLDSQKRPRYTFDKITPVLESMMADIEDMDFGANVKPAGGGADKDLALTYEGMIRTIQNESRADSIYRNACRRVMRRGFDAWMVRAKYADAWSFEQDLFIVPIPNAINRVWGSNASKRPDSSDSDFMYVLTSISLSEFKERWPDRKPVSVDDYSEDRTHDNYEPDVVVIAERFYKKKRMIEVAQMSNGEVFEVNDDYKKIKDDLLLLGVSEARIKKVEDFNWCYGVFDGTGIIEYDKPTPFKSNPIITVYGNYEHVGSNSKITYSGFVLKELDAQRVHNYAKSRDIEEGALAPRAKWWMTKAQAKGNEDQISRMNISADPVQFYTPDPNGNVPPPFYQQVSQANPHLAALGNQMAADIKEQAGVFSAMQGDFAGRMSEDTVRMQIDRGTAATRKWVNAIIDGIRRTCEVLVETIPIVYDTKRQFTITGIDGTENQVLLNEEIYDQSSGQMVKINDLNKGKYKVVCDAGPAFANRLEAGLDALLNYAKIDPTIVQQAGDIMLKSIDAPMVDQVAERKRKQLLQAGQIPEDQMTDEEKQLMQALSSQPQQPSVEQILLQIEATKAQNEQAKLIQTGQIKTMELQLKAQQQELEKAKLQVQALQDARKQSLDEAQGVADIENTKADTISKIANAEKTSGETVAQQIENLKAVTPQVTIMAVEGQEGV